MREPFPSRPLFNLKRFVLLVTELIFNWTTTGEACPRKQLNDNNRSNNHKTRSRCSCFIRVQGFFKFEMRDRCKDLRDRY